MKTSTRNSLVGKIMDFMGINNRFHRYETIEIDAEARVISPVEARVANVGKISDKGKLISKNNKEVNLKDLMGDYSNNFFSGTYINFYLSPLNRHFWVTPCDGHFIYTQKNEGKTKFPVFLGLENLFGIEMFSKAAERNASISSILKTKESVLAMIAVGSLNVNRVHVDYEEGISYTKGTPCGYFSLGSSMLLCFPDNPEILVKNGERVRLGQKII